LVCASEKRHVPGKLFEYLRSGKPILAFGDANEEVQRILEEANAGVIFPLTADGKEFFERIKDFKSDIHAVQQYDRKEIAMKLAQILRETIAAV
jgi:glycosyltransferase involved in cell wall biosynthesis